MPQATSFFTWDPSALKRQRRRDGRPAPHDHGDHERAARAQWRRRRPCRAESLLERLAERRREFDQADGTIPKSLFEFLKFWLQGHIRGIDRKYGDFAPDH